MTDTINIIVRVSTDAVGSECRADFQMDRAAWDALTDEQREAACQEAAFDLVEWNWEVET